MQVYYNICCWESHHVTIGSIFGICSAAIEHGLCRHYLFLLSGILFGNGFAFIMLSHESDDRINQCACSLEVRRSNHKHNLFNVAHNQCRYGQAKSGKAFTSHSHVISCVSYVPHFDFWNKKSSKLVQYEPNPQLGKNYCSVLHMPEDGDVFLMCSVLLLKKKKESCECSTLTGKPYFGDGSVKL